MTYIVFYECVEVVVPEQNTALILSKHLWGNLWLQKLKESDDHDYINVNCLNKVLNLQNSDLNNLY